MWHEFLYGEPKSDVSPTMMKTLRFSVCPLLPVQSMINVSPKKTYGFAFALFVREAKPMWHALVCKHLMCLQQ